MSTWTAPTPLRRWIWWAGYPNLRWWISTLDNNPHWTAEELAADLRDNWHADIAAADLWGVQYSGGMTAEFDTSLLLGSW